ncbi:MAG TPA: Maf family protein [Verrucomicrobiae bacterium]|jgi:septum formation protein|nr:Maf family protein [Verrucomicrobiae bacterium]
MKLILASSSPRRQDLLHQAGIPFEVHAAHIPEIHNPGEPPLDYAMRLAREKALAVAGKFPGRFVLGADTIVVVGDQLLEKPRDTQDAVRMLHLLSGRGHEVTTAVSLVLPDESTDSRHCTTQVFFRELLEQEIQDYAASGEPADKAGAYAIQGGAARWNVRLEGEYSNVVGLPLPLVREMLRANGFL